MKNNKLSLLQISDFHLFSSAQAELMGLNTHDSLAAVLHEIGRGERRPDLVIASGDLVHDGSAGGYARMTHMLSGLAAPVYCMPGNHDEKRRLREILSTQCEADCEICAPGSVDCGEWRLILLDTVVDDEKHGHLADDELERLALCLRSAGDKQVMIFLHHQPLAVGSAWLDSMQVDNAAAFFEIVDKYSNVRAISWGHVHQVFEGCRNNVRLYSAPSTCIQFTAGSDAFALDDEASPGWRWFTLYGDGRLETEVDRLATAPVRRISSADEQGYQ